MRMESMLGLSRAEAFPAGLRVLVVDDDPTWLKILEKMLRKCSYDVTTCALARVALDLLREKKGKFDIVISDVNMPDMDGFKLLEYVGLEMDLPVIMMSVDGETSRVMKGVQHGACDYFIKPVRMKELRNIWQHVYRKRIHEVRDLDSLGSIEDIQIFRGVSDDFDERQVLSGVDLGSIRKRKDMDAISREHSEHEYADGGSAVKKARVVWSVDLHKKFVNAVDQIGYEKVGPKKILDLMNVPGLTRENVASHLQKYRLYLSRLQKQGEVRMGENGGNNPPEFGSKDASAVAFLPRDSIAARPNQNHPTRYACGSNTQKNQTQSIFPGVQTDDQKGVVSQEEIGGVSQLGAVLSFKGMMMMPPDVEYKPFEPAVSRLQQQQQPWNGTFPEMQFKNRPKAVTTSAGGDTDGGGDFGGPSFSWQDKEISALEKSRLSGAASHIRSKPVSPPQLEQASVSPRGFVASPFGPNGTPPYEMKKNVYLDQALSYSIASPSRDLSPRGAGAGDMDPTASFESLMGIFENADSDTAAQVHGSWSDGLQFDGEYIYDSMEYPPLDDYCLFT